MAFVSGLTTDIIKFNVINRKLYAEVKASMFQKMIKKIAIVSHEKILYINVFEVVFLESQKDFIKAYLTEGKEIIIRKQLSKVQDLLPNIFVRVTQCVVINKLFLNYIERKEKYISMHGEFKIPFTMALGKLVDRIGEISSVDVKDLLHSDTKLNGNLHNAKYNLPSNYSH